MDPEQQSSASLKSRWWSPDFPLKPRRCSFFYGWVVVALGTLGICVSMPGQTIGVSVFTTRLMDALGLSAMQLSVAYMVGTFLSALLLSQGGRLFDRFGARKAVVGSLVGFGLVLIGLSFVEHIVAWFSHFPGMGLRAWLPSFVVLSLGFACLRFTGQGMVTLSSRAMLGKWFDRRRGAVTAWSGAVVSFAFSGAPMGFEYLIQSFGWQGAWRVMGVFMLLGMAVLFWVFARDNPEECGLELDGGFMGEARPLNPDSVIYRDYTLKEARRTFAFWAFAAMFALNSLVITAYAFHVLAVARELGVSSNYILGLFVPSAAVAVVAGFAVGWLSDQPFVRIKYLLCLMAVSSLLGYVMLAVGAYPRFSWLHILGLGVAGGCFGSLSSIVWPRFFGRQHLGAISGLFMTVIVVASALGPFLFSVAQAQLGSYRSGFIFAALCAAVVAIASLRADNPQRAEAPSVGES